MKKSDAFEKFIRILKTEPGLIWFPAYQSNAKKTEISLKLYQQIFETSQNLKIVLGGITHYKSVDKIWSSIGLRKKISTGLYFITSALSLCNHVNVYGFWPYPVSPDGRNLTFRYYGTDSEKFAFQTDWFNEIKAIMSLHQQGLVKVHVGNCDL